MSRASDSSTSCATSVSVSARALCCCLLLLTGPPLVSSFQISSRILRRDIIGIHNKDVSPPLRSSQFLALGATRETRRSDEVSSNLTLKDREGDDGGISDDDKMTIPLMDIENDEISSSSDASDLPGTADAFDYAGQAFLEWSSGTSIGSFLLQRQREEEDAVIVRGVDAKTGQAEYSTETTGVGASSSKVDDSERLVRDQSRRMEGRKRRKERRKDRLVEAQLEELREQQRRQQEQQTGSLGGVQIIDDTASTGVGKKLIEDEKSSADASRKGRRKDRTDREERKSRARLWRRKKRDQAKARQKSFDIDKVRLSSTAVSVVIICACPTHFDLLYNFSCRFLFCCRSWPIR